VNAHHENIGLFPTVSAVPREGVHQRNAAVEETVQARIFRDERPMAVKDKFSFAV